VAFVGVRDYMSDGHIKHAVADALRQICKRDSGSQGRAGRGPLQPSRRRPLDTVVNEETAAVQQAPAKIEPAAPPPAETQMALVSTTPEAVTQTEEQPASPAVEPLPEAQAAPTEVEPEPEPQAEVQISAPAPPVEAPPPAAQQVAAADRACS